MAITPNLIHANWIHWFLNIINLVAIFLIYNRVWSAKKFLIFFTLASWFVTCCLYLFSIEVANYVGLSGVLYSIAVYSALAGFKEQKAISALLLVYVLSKLLFHDFINKITFTTDLLSGLNVVTDVHWYGALFGFFVFGCGRSFKYLKLY